MKKQCRKAERMWRKTKIEIHYGIYKDSLHAFNVELATARQTFFSNLINSNLNNTSTLFATVERLTNPPSQIPSEMLADTNAMSLLPSFLRRSIISERRLAHPQVMQRSHRFDRNFKKKWLCLFFTEVLSGHALLIFFLLVFSWSQHNELFSRDHDITKVVFSLSRLIFLVITT